MHVREKRTDPTRFSHVFHSHRSQHVNSSEIDGRGHVGYEKLLEFTRELPKSDRPYVGYDCNGDRCIFFHGPQGPCLVMRKGLYDIHVYDTRMQRYHIEGPANPRPKPTDPEPMWQYIQKESP